MTTTWPAATIGELFEIGAGKSVTPAARHGEPKHPFLRTANILWGRIDLSEVDAMYFSKEELETKTLRKGDLLVCEGGDIGRSAIWTGGVDSCSFQNHLHRLRPRSSEVFPRFYMYFLQAGFTQLGLYDGVGNKTTIPNLSRNGLAALEVPKPKRGEQEKIAAVLWKVQSAIEIEERLIVVARELKQSAMHQLFMHGLRSEQQKESLIGRVPESWAIKRLEDCCEVVSSSLSYTDFSTMPDSEAEDAVVSMGIKVSDMNLAGNEHRITKSNLHKRIQLSLARKKFVAPGTVVFPKRGAAIATNKKRVTTAWTVLDPNLIGVQGGEGVDTDYLFYWFQTFDLRTITEPGPTPQLNKKNLVPLLLPIPATKDEQREIAAVMRKIDNKIDAHVRKRAALQDLFKTLLHKLMVGEIRVADLDIDTSDVLVH
jgi:type I restriction enzyme S subunit